MDLRRHVILLSLLTATVVAPTLLFAGNGGGSDRVQLFQSINIGPDESVGDVVCIGCSIHMAGTSGDTVAILGSIVVEGTVKGDVVAVGGGVTLNEDASVSGDTVALGSGLHRHPNAAVKGEVVSQVGPLIFLGLIIGPFLPIIVIVLLIVWLVRRDRPITPAPVAYRR
jgi:hypothetical protein